MESEFNAQSAPAAAFVVKESSSEEVLLPAARINGNSEVGEGGAIDFLEETDPMLSDNDPMENIKAENIKQDDVDAAEGEGETEELDETVEEFELEDEGEEYEEEAAEEGGEPTVQRTPTQVPKKRKDAAILAAAADDGEQNDEKDQEQEEQPTSSTRAASRKENTVDEEQCRVCTGKEDLVSLFKKVEKQTVAEMLMTICPTVSIARKDFMPQYICNPCLDNVTISVQLKAQCETTERELRKKLSRSKNKLRRPTGYVVIDAPVESDPPSEEEPTDDVEFKVSDVEVSASVDEDDSDDSDFGSIKKKRPSRGGGARRGRRKSAVKTPTPKVKEKRRMGRPPVKRAAESSEEDQVERSPAAPKKKKHSSVNAGRDSTDKPSEYPCDECEQIFTRKLSLVLHKKVHSGGREPINCEVCGKQFKIQGAYRTHLEKHKDESNGHGCGKCDRTFNTKSELRRHLAEDHDEPGVVYQCTKCKRNFVSETRLSRHKDGRCPGFESHKQKRHDFEGFAVGKDLFKAVAPLTTTYWSDSFSD